MVSFPRHPPWWTLIDKGVRDNHLLALLITGYVIDWVEIKWDRFIEWSKHNKPSAEGSKTLRSLLVSIYRGPISSQLLKHKTLLNAQTIDTYQNQVSSQIIMSHEQCDWYPAPCCLAETLCAIFLTSALWNLAERSNS